MDYTKISNIEVEGIDTSDYPDFCDAFIANATYDGNIMNEKQLKELNENSCFVNEAVFNSIY